MNNITTNDVEPEFQDTSPGSIVTRWLGVEQVSDIKREASQGESSDSTGKTITFSASIESDLRWTMTLVGAQFMTIIGSAIAILSGQ